MRRPLSQREFAFEQILLEFAVSAQPPNVPAAQVRIWPRQDPFGDVLATGSSHDAQIVFDERHVDDGFIRRRRGYRGFVLHCASKNIPDTPGTWRAKLMSRSSECEALNARELMSTRAAILRESISQPVARLTDRFDFGRRCPERTDT